MTNTPNGKEWGGISGGSSPDFRIYDEAMTLEHKNPPSSGDSARVFALIPCAGNGSRSGSASPKQYQMLLGKAMVQHTLEAFRAVQPGLAGLWVVVSEGDTGFLSACLGFAAPGEVLLYQGGATRAASVLNGLKAMLAPASGAPAVADAQDWVLVHDAARCLITPAQISALIEICQADAVGGLLAQQVPDTLKSATGGRVALTIERSDKYLAQTPQMFRIGALIAALESAGNAVTDESSAMEAMGLSPRLVMGSAQNFKVTYPDDFALAEAILASRSKPVLRPASINMTGEALHECK